jgi:hypothetical protein
MLSYFDMVYVVILNAQLFVFLSLLYFVFCLCLAVLFTVDMALANGDSLINSILTKNSWSYVLNNELVAPLL